MIIGQAGCGKSTIFNILLKSLERLNLKYPENENYFNVKIYKLNPKSVSINNLYGYIN